MHIKDPQKTNFTIPSSFLHPVKHAQFVLNLKLHIFLWRILRGVLYSKYSIFKIMAQPVLGAAINALFVFGISLPNTNLTHVLTLYETLMRRSRANADIHRAKIATPRPGGVNILKFK